MKLSTPGILAGALLLGVCSQSFASLTTFQTYTGANYGVSTAGFGSISNSGTILTSVPVGATLVSAYLYSGYYDFNGGFVPTVTLNGSSVAFGAPVLNTTACCGLGSVRADVTSIVQSALATAGGPSATPFGLSVLEGGTDGSSGTDGEELVSVYKYATGDNHTVAILDGFASVTGDTATVNLATPITATTGVQLMLGDNFSCCGQASTVTVDGTLITAEAGNNDDCDTGVATNGCLITVGTNLNDGDPSVSDPFSPLLPTYDQDHERYDLSPELALGSSTITVTTANASQDDNIFAAVFKISGDAEVISGAPEPSTWLMLGVGLVGMGVAGYRRKRA